MEACACLLTFVGYSQKWQLSYHAGNVYLTHTRTQLTLTVSNFAAVFEKLTGLLCSSGKSLMVHSAVLTRLQL